MPIPVPDAGFCPIIILNGFIVGVTGFLILSIYKGMRLVSVSPSDRSDKKYKALFEAENGKRKTVHFGQKGAEDFTIHKDPVRRSAYQARHKGDLKTGDPTRPGFLSYYILWNKPTLQESIVDYRRRFGL